MSKSGKSGAPSLSETTLSDTTPQTTASLPYRLQLRRHGEEESRKRGLQKKNAQDRRGDTEATIKWLKIPVLSTL